MAADVAHGVDLRSGRNCADRRGVVGFAEIKDPVNRHASGPSASTARRKAWPLWPSPSSRIQAADWSQYMVRSAPGEAVASLTKAGVNLVFMGGSLCGKRRPGKAKKKGARFGWKRTPATRRSSFSAAACAALNHTAYRASGSERIWKCTAIGLLPLPPSVCHGARSPLLTHNPLPFHPASGSSIRPSSPLAKKPIG